MDQTQEVFEKLRDTNKNLPQIGGNIKIGGNKTTSMHQSMQIDSIKVNTKYGSLKSALDSLELIPEYEEGGEGKVVNNDLFKERRKSDQEKDEEKQKIEASLEEINKFNSMIMKNSQWGSSIPAKSGNKKITNIPLKPNHKELERELGTYNNIIIFINIFLIFLGKSIVNTKLPRARQLSKVHAAIFVKKDQNMTLADQTIYSHLVIEEGGSLILKNVNVMGDVDNKGDVKTQGNVVFNGKIKTTNKITAMKKQII